MKKYTIEQWKEFIEQERQEQKEEIRKKKNRIVKPYLELPADSSEKTHRDRNRDRVKKLGDLDHYKGKDLYVFEVQFPCPECGEQTRGQIAISRHSPKQKCETIGFVTFHWCMCNKCYYGI